MPSVKGRLFCFVLIIIQGKENMFKKKNPEIEKKVKEYKQQLIEEQKRKDVLFEHSLRDYLQELVNNVSRKNVKARITKPSGEVIEIWPIETTKQPDFIGPEEIY